MNMMLSEEIRAHALRAEEASRQQREGEYKHHRDHIDALGEHMRIVQAHVNRQTAALEAIASHLAPDVSLAPSPSAPTEQPNGEPIFTALGTICPATGMYVSRCTHCGAEPLNAFVVESSPPAQAATEVTHAEVRRIADRIDRDGTWLADGDKLRSYIDQQSRRDAAAQVKTPHACNNCDRPWSSHAPGCMYAAHHPPPGQNDQATEVTHEERDEYAIENKRLQYELRAARAAALPAGVAELLSEWRGVRPDYQNATLEALHRRADGIAARLLGALAATGKGAP